MCHSKMDQMFGSPIRYPMPEEDRVYLTSHRNLPQLCRTGIVPNRVGYTNGMATFVKLNKQSKYNPTLDVSPSDTIVVYLDVEACMVNGSCYVTADYAVQVTHVPAACILAINDIDGQTWYSPQNINLRTPTNFPLHGSTTEYQHMFRCCDCITTPPSALQKRIQQRVTIANEAIGFQEALRSIKKKHMAKPTQTIKSILQQNHVRLESETPLIPIASRTKETHDGTSFPTMDIATTRVLHNPGINYASNDDEQEEYKVNFLSHLLLIINVGYYLNLARSQPKIEDECDKQETSMTAARINGLF